MDYATYHLLGEPETTIEPSQGAHWKLTNGWLENHQFFDRRYVFIHGPVSNVIR